MARALAGYDWMRRATWWFHRDRLCRSGRQPREVAREQDGEADVWQVEELHEERSRPMAKPSCGGML